MATDKTMLGQLLTESSLRRMAGSRAFSRGVEYFNRGQVGSIVERKDSIAARVEGARVHRARLWIHERALDYSCTCPIGEDGEFCKHCVALGLTWLDHGHASTGNQSTSSRYKVNKPATTMQDVRGYLTAQKTSVLVDLLLKHAEDDETLRRRLLMLAASKARNGLDLATYRQAIEDAVIPEEFVRYGEMYDYARRLDGVIGSLEDLLREGHAAGVIELAEHALQMVEQAMQSVDDSAGQMGEVFERLQNLHYAACRKAKPDPQAFAKRLFEWELGSGWDTFSGAAERYADVLGSKGLAIYRQLAEQRWAHVAELGAGERASDQDGARFRITQIMEALARQTGDVEALVAIKRRDLSSSWSYLQIAESYRQAKKHDLALEWAERGMKEFARDPDRRLREFLADEYHRRKRHVEAMEMVWADFRSAPHLNSYRNLKGHADRTKQWPQWRERALGVMREKIDQAKKKSSERMWGRSDHSELVEIFLWEKDFASAWHEAKKGGCYDGLWNVLAAWREKEHPQDAIPIYWKEVDGALKRMGNEAYREAIRVLRRIRGLMKRIDKEAQFAHELAALRTAHKAKRNFIKLLDHARWD